MHAMHAPPNMLLYGSSLDPSKRPGCGIAGVGAWVGDKPGTVKKPIGCLKNVNSYNSVGSHPRNLSLIHGIDKPGRTTAAKHSASAAIWSNQLPEMTAVFEQRQNNARVLNTTSVATATRHGLRYPSNKLALGSSSVRNPAFGQLPEFTTHSFQAENQTLFYGATRHSVGHRFEYVRSPTTTPGIQEKNGASPPNLQPVSAVPEVAVQHQSTKSTSLNFPVLFQTLSDRPTCNHVRPQMFKTTMHEPILATSTAMQFGQAPVTTSKSSYVRPKYARNVNFTSPSSRKNQEREKEEKQTVQAGSTTPHSVHLYIVQPYSNKKPSKSNGVAPSAKVGTFPDTAVKLNENDTAIANLKYNGVMRAFNIKCSRAKKRRINHFGSEGHVIEKTKKVKKKEKLSEQKLSKNSNRKNKIQNNSGKFKTCHRNNSSEELNRNRLSKRHRELLDRLASSTLTPAGIPKHSEAVIQCKRANAVQCNGMVQDGISNGYVVEQSNEFAETNPNTACSKTDPQSLQIKATIPPIVVNNSLNGILVSSTDSTVRQLDHPLADAVSEFERCSEARGDAPRLATGFSPDTNGVSSIKPLSNGTHSAQGVDELSLLNLGTSFLSHNPSTNELKNERSQTSPEIISDKQEVLDIQNQKPRNEPITSSTLSSVLDRPLDFSMKPPRQILGVDRRCIEEQKAPLDLSTRRLTTDNPGRKSCKTSAMGKSGGQMPSLQVQSCNHPVPTSKRSETFGVVHSGASSLRKTDRLENLNGTKSPSKAKRSKSADTRTTTENIDLLSSKIMAGIRATAEKHNVPNCQLQALGYYPYSGRVQKKLLRRQKSAFVQAKVHEPLSRSGENSFIGIEESSRKNQYICETRTKNTAGARAPRNFQSENRPNLHKSVTTTATAPTAEGSSSGVPGSTGTLNFAANVMFFNRVLKGTSNEVTGQQICTGKIRAEEGMLTSQSSVISSDQWCLNAEIKKETASLSRLKRKAQKKLGYNVHTDLSKCDINVKRRKLVKKLAPSVHKTSKSNSRKSSCILLSDSSESDDDSNGFKQIKSDDKIMKISGRTPSVDKERDEDEAEVNQSQGTTKFDAKETKFIGLSQRPSTFSSSRCDNLPIQDSSHCSPGFESDVSVTNALRNGILETTKNQNEGNLKENNAENEIVSSSAEVSSIIKPSQGFDVDQCDLHDDVVKEQKNNSNVCENVSLQQPMTKELDLVPELNESKSPEGVGHVHRKTENEAEKLDLHISNLDACGKDANITEHDPSESRSLQDDSNRAIDICTPGSLESNCCTPSNISDTSSNFETDLQVISHGPVNSKADSSSLSDPGRPVAASLSKKEHPSTSENSLPNAITLETKASVCDLDSTSRRSDIHSALPSSDKISLENPGEADNCESSQSCGFLPEINGSSECGMIKQKLDDDGRNRSSISLTTPISRSTSVNATASAVVSNELEGTGQCESGHNSLVNRTSDHENGVKDAELEDVSLTQPPNSTTLKKSAEVTPSLKAVDTVENLKDNDVSIGTESIEEQFHSSTIKHRSTGNPPQDQSGLNLIKLEVPIHAEDDEVFQDDFRTPLSNHLENKLDSSKQIGEHMPCCLEMHVHSQESQLKVIKDVIPGCAHTLPMPTLKDVSYAEKEIPSQRSNHSTEQSASATSETEKDCLTAQLLQSSEETPSSTVGEHLTENVQPKECIKRKARITGNWHGTNMNTLTRIPIIPMFRKSVEVSKTTRDKDFRFMMKKCADLGLIQDRGAKIGTHYKPPGRNHTLLFQHHSVPRRRHCSQNFMDQGRNHLFQPPLYEAGLRPRSISMKNLKNSQVFCETHF